MKKSASAKKIPLSWQPVKPKKLRYIEETSRGYSRKKSGKNFVFLDDKGKQIKNKDVVNRIRHLVIPPAWKDVWICPFEDGHLQATGRDARGRKQYRYHADCWENKSFVFGQFGNDVRDVERMPD